MRRVIALALVLAGCVHHARAPGLLQTVTLAPKIVTIQTQPRHGLHCPIPAAPAYPDAQPALDTAPGLTGAVADLSAGRVARDAYIAALTAALKACR